MTTTTPGRLKDAARRALDAERDMRDLNGPALIAFAVSAIDATPTELARLSGLNPNTLRALRAGKQATAAQRAALAWAIFARWA